MLSRPVSIVEDLLFGLLEYIGSNDKRAVTINVDVQIEQLMRCFAPLSPHLFGVAMSKNSRIASQSFVFIAPDKASA